MPTFVPQHQLFQMKSYKNAHTLESKMYIAHTHAQRTYHHTHWFVLKNLLSADFYSINVTETILNLFNDLCAESEEKELYIKGITTLNVKAQTILGVHSDSLAQTFSHKSVKTNLDQV